MDLSRTVYSRDLKVAAMRALDAGSTNGEIARKYQVSPHLLDRWRGEWRAKGDLPADLHRYLFKVANAKLYDRNNALVAADMLNDCVVPFFETQQVPLLRILTDRSTEYCGQREHHEYQ